MEPGTSPSQLGMMMPQQPASSVGTNPMPYNYNGNFIIKIPLFTLNISTALLKLFFLLSPGFIGDISNFNSPEELTGFGYTFVQSPPAIVPTNTVSSNGESFLETNITATFIASL